MIISGVRHMLKESKYHVKKYIDTVYKNKEKVMIMKTVSHFQNIFHLINVIGHYSISQQLLTYYCTPLINRLSLMPPCACFLSFFFF